MRVAAAQDADPDASSHAISSEQVQQVFRHLHRMTIERQQYVTDHQARARGRTVVDHVDNQQTLLLFAPTALRVGEADRLTREAEISAFRPAVRENSGGRNVHAIEAGITTPRPRMAQPS